MNKHTLSVVMPALNEEKNVKAAVKTTLQALKRHGIDGEIIIINDGSTDNTAEIANNLSENNDNIRVIHHEQPKGIGKSFWAGAKMSQNDVVVMFPGDNENDPDEALAYFDLMEKVDIIVPFIHNIEVRDKKRRLISAIYNFIINMSFGIKINYHNGTVFYRRAILNDIELSNFGFFYQAELIIKLLRKGYLFVEVPNYLGQRGSGKSKALTWKSFCQIVKSYIKLVFEIHIKLIEGKRTYRGLNPESVTYLRNSTFDCKCKIERKKDEISQ